MRQVSRRWALPYRKGKLKILVTAVLAVVVMAAPSPAQAAKPGPVLPPGGTTTQACPGDQVVESGTATYWFKGKKKTTVTSYTEGGFNAFGEPTTATFTTPLEPRLDAIRITLVCVAPTFPDTDGDGLADNEDQCPNHGGIRLTFGCPDLDFDAVWDFVDACPTEAGDMPDGCPDSDGDGLSDAEDQCPNHGGIRLTFGCPDLDFDAVWDFVDACPTEAGDMPDGCPDSDGDGFSDAEDLCPNEPGSPDLGLQGCPGIETTDDNDGDGTPDVDDACPSTPGPAANDGCPWPDSDGDGFSDAEDHCPTQAGIPPDGCPGGVEVFDGDGDGVPDGQDACPNEPGLPPTGCPLPDPLP